MSGHTPGDMRRLALRLRHGERDQRSGVIESRKTADTMLAAAEMLERIALAIGGSNDA